MDEGGSGRRRGREGSGWVVAGLVLAAAPLWAGEGGVSSSLMEAMTRLVFQLGVILFAAKIFGALAAKVRMPSVLGEMTAGVLLGPFVLGGMPLPGFPDGLFPMAEGAFPISPELYGLSVVASVILLFKSGLETDLHVLLSYFGSSLLIGFGGVVVSFFAGQLVAVGFLGTGLMDPRALVLGIIGTATSVGITARILSEQRKTDSPEGVSIIAGAVIDDVIGVILLAVVLSVIVSFGRSGRIEIPWKSIEEVTVKTVAIWLGFTAAGLFFAQRIGHLLKRFRSRTAFAVLGLGLALLLAGVFEKAGLAMIIGAYVMGLTLSNTELSHVIQEGLESLQEFFVPIFFVTMGMLMDVRAFLEPRNLVFGLAYTAAAVAAKVLGSGLPSLATNFNLLGALRIGVGMVPRGEVALIIAGIGLAYGIIGQEVFSVTVIMVLVTLVVIPPVLTFLFSVPKEGVKGRVKGRNEVRTVFEFPSEELCGFFVNKVVEQLRNEGFFVTLITSEYAAYYFRKDHVFIEMEHEGTRIEFLTRPEDVAFVKATLYESYCELAGATERLKEFAGGAELAREMLSLKSAETVNIGALIDERCIAMDLKATDKEGVLRELVDLLARNGKLADRERVLADLLERERSMSTGMQDGIALPHAKTEGVVKPVIAIGLKRDGLDFGSLDGLPSRIFVMTLIPAEGTAPYLQVLSTLAAVLSDHQNRAVLLRYRYPDQVRQFFIERSRKRKGFWRALIDTLRGV